MTKQEDLIQYFNVLAQQTIKIHDEAMAEQDTDQLCVRPEMCVKTPKGLVVMGFNTKKQRWQVKLGRRLIAWNDNRKDFAQVGSFIANEFEEAAQ